MHLPPGDYCIVAYKPDGTDYGYAYGPGCQTLDVEMDEVHSINFALASIPTGNVIVDVQETGGEMPTVSFRQLGSEVGCAGCLYIEVSSVTSRADPVPYTYAIGLPGGEDPESVTYWVVPFTDCGDMVKEETVEAYVTAYTDTTPTGDPFEFSPCPIP
jgi:hypothetical protein